MIKFITKMGKRIKSSVSARNKRGKGGGDDKKSATSKIKSTAEVVIVNTISVAENVVWLFFIFLLIFMLIIASIVFAVVGSAFGVLSITSATVNNNINIVGGGNVTDYSAYDWYGNMTANLLKLKGKDKNYYRLIAMSYQFVDYSRTASDSEKWHNGVWDAYVGLGSAYLESGLMLPSDEQNVLETAFPFRSAGDGKGDDPLGITFTLATSKTEDYTWGSYTHDTCKNKSTLEDNVRKVQTNRGITLNVNDAFGIYYYPGAFKWTLLHTAARAFGGDMGVETQKAYIKDKLKEYGLSQSNENVNIIEIMSMYSCHHGTDIDALKRTIEVSVATLAYCDGSLDNVEFTNVSKQYDGSIINMFDAKDSTFGEYVSCDSGTEINRSAPGNGYGLKITRKGNVVTETQKSLFKLIYDEYSSRHTFLKTVVTELTPSYGGTRYSMNYPSGVATYLIGKAVVKYIADQCNIVLDSPSVKDWGASTQTVNAMLTLVDKWDKAHNYSTSDPWVAGHTPPSAEQGEDETGTFPVDWCAYTVRSTFQHVKINGSSTTVYDAIRKESGGTAFFTSDFADMGYDDGNTNIYSSTEYGGIGASSIASNKYVAMHFTGNYKGWTRQDPAIDYMGKISKETRYMPKAGDIIIYMLGSGHYSHVGIITGCDGKTVSTIEGNAIYTPDGILSYGRKTKSVDDSTIAFYISIDYEGLEKKYGKPSTSSTNAVNIKDYLNGSSESSLTGSQLVVVKSSGTSAQITVLEKVGGKWYSKLSTSGYVGAGGVGQASESTNKTPKGIYYLGKNFGGFGVKMSGLKIGWKDVSSTQSYWGSSNNSNHLNRFYTASKKETSGDEDLTAICKSGAYKYSVLIEYNYSNATKGKGSAFFLHIGSSATAGCVAISESDMLSVVEWLDKSKSPQILIY